MLRGAIILALAGIASSAALADAGQCLTLRSPVPTGGFLTPEVVEEVPCREDRALLPLRYDRGAKAPVAAEDLASGTYLGRISLRPGTIAAAGEKLQLVIHEGPVTIIRDVVPARAVRDRERAFVKTEDGQVLTALFVAAENRP
ncbi:MAG: hypothetical protein P0Y56_14060 [Candidatus Andeanibacterium colombiense]|uniref:Flagella basal body P-ring formation protein FlgA C-terminal domain-containing protein n=1 Tax=Candidatus Andeanibacterium colombiense TaxID=3121345 RepID=A0AAJ5X522_9SPHN|nr:MAG: hypothetical protein P0Y56_14060 [Sphingomonadaceae bacterium]